MSLFDELKNNKDIIYIYNNVDEKDKENLIATHGWKHINKVISIVEKILTELDYDNNTIENGKIAALLHDIGCIDGKDNHAFKSYEMAKVLLNDKKINKEDKEIILQAILKHSKPKENDTIIGKTLALADKIDFDKNRMCPLGLKEKHYCQMNNIEKVEISIGKIVEIKFIVNEKFDRVDLEEYYFVKKIFEAIREFSKYVSKKYQIKINDEIWENNMKDLIYVTGNQYKIFTAKKFLEPYGINVIGKKIDCIEIQADKIEDVAIFSSKYACEKLNCAVLKNDMGLVIPALNGFPSAYTHYADDTIAEDGILKLMDGIEDRRAYFLECLAYTEPGKETKVFYSKTEGTIDTKKSGEYGWSWDRIFIPSGQKVPMANFNDDDRAKLWSEEGYKELAEYLNRN